MTIGEKTKIWHFCHIMSNSNIGYGCSLGQNVVVGPNVNIEGGVNYFLRKKRYHHMPWIVARSRIIDNA